MKDRKTLKNYFRKGNLPSEANFENLIDSSVNKIDDGFSKTEDEGLMLSNIGESEKIISFYEDIEDDFAQWAINLNKFDNKSKGPRGALNFMVPETGNTVLSLTHKNRVGINQTDPAYDLHVNRLIASGGRVGTFCEDSEIPADGKWYRIIQNLNYCQAFEIVARTGIKDSGKHSLLHAIAVSAYGRSNSRIRNTGARYSFWRPCRIQLRWTGDTFNYHLEMRCRQDLGPGTKIKYYVTQLWSDEDMGIPAQFRDSDNS